jgi:hypothetical protein
MTFLAHAAFFAACWHYAMHGLGGQPGRASLIVSAIFTGTIGLQFIYLLRTYANVFSRVLFHEGLFLAVPLAIVSLLIGPDPVIRVLATASIAGWGWMYWVWRKRAAIFVKQGCGPVPAYVWVSPDADAIRVGDVILTSGRMAALLHQSIGHVEVAIMMDGELVLFSAWFETGACVNPVVRICKPSERNHYIVRRPRVPWTPLQIATVELVAKSMLVQNRLCAERIKAKREKLPAVVRHPLDRYFPATGYDWLSMYNGKRRRDCWSCIGIYLELMHRAGIDIGAESLGAGVAGANTGWFDVLNAEDLRNLKALRDLTLTDKAEHEAARAQTAVATAAGETTA